MKKVKLILSENRIAQILILLAILLMTIILVMSGYKQTSSIKFCSNQVSVNTGDTLMDILTAQGVSAGDALNIAKVLKADAGISGLRADNDKIIFSRIRDNAPVSKIVLIPSPWRQVELSCNNGNWVSDVIDINPDTRAVYKSGEIHDGDSFYTAGARAGFQMRFWQMFMICWRLKLTLNVMFVQDKNFQFYTRKIILMKNK